MSWNVPGYDDKTVKPISPDEVVDQKEKNFPWFVWEAFNELIAENWTGRGTIKILKGDAVNRISSKMIGRQIDTKRKIIYDKGWLNVEDAYRKAGWKVAYNKPAYNESYDAFYIFSKA